MKKTILLTALLAVTTSAFATGFVETEDNNIKAAANAFTMAAGDTISGASTGSSTTAAGLASADYFKVTMGSTASGIWERRLAITTAGTAGHTGTIRGLTVASGGVVNAGTDAGLTTTLSTTTPARYVQWYGWGAAESLYYRVTGTASTTADYLVTLTETLVTPVSLGSISVGSHTFGVNSTADTEITIFDGSMNVIAQDDDDAATTSSSIGSMPMTNGTYYIAIGRYNTCTNVPQTVAGSYGTETFTTGSVLDFAGALTSTSTSTTSTTAQLQIDGVNIGPAGAWTGIADAYKVHWYQVNVVPEPASMIALGAGALALIRRRRSK